MSGGLTRFTPANVDKRGWEKSDFPIICETCLGPNPYVRMTRAEFDHECKICMRPFTVFRWRPGKDARFKKTEVCQTCAKLKNVCQVCLLDLEYGLPVQVRDRALSQAGVDSVEMPHGDANREFFHDQAEQTFEAGMTLPYDKLEPTAMLTKLARTTPYYKRNAPHVCSFWLKGECKRGAQCPYRHEAPPTGDTSQQNLRDRYYGVNDPVARKMLGKADGFMAPLTAPEDKTIATLFVGGLHPATTDVEVRDAFYSFGELKTVKLIPHQQCAFVTFTTREAAEQAAQKTFGSLKFHEQQARIAWGRPVFHDGSGASRAPAAAAVGVPPPPPPPGMVSYIPPPPGVTRAPAMYPSMDPSQQGSAPEPR